MRRKGKRAGDDFPDLVEMTEPFLPDESTATAREITLDLRERIVKLEQQVQAQYSAMAAYATIAQQGVDGARAEARHDLDRSQATLIGLIEKVRRECADAIQGAEVRLGGGPEGDHARLSAVEDRLATIEALLTTSLDAQRQLMDTVQLLMQERMQREGWLVASGSEDGLSLR